ncbi:DUF4369 domain-containing protein [Lutimonas saemankumensis]|uniref:DUF4369 domain-containing protein n=1 Tax=Lutimonas saemankumensis TaxID=483016 RepID=UPI001CD24393|nr:DUF4369 domain-containing protein [Lutimonas saemankumensis]MCA0931199.1 DUF4369 domain-containing protein [Lutimonas saemankumensis]
MKKTGLIIVIALAIAACSKESDNTMYVKAQIKGLKKGTFFLQKQMDSLIVSVDSVSVNGKEDFVLTDQVDSPEMYYLTLGNSSKRIAFFGEKDTVYINSQLDLFAVKAKIKGSDNQDILNQFNEFQQKFKDQRLDLVKEEFEARKKNSQDSIDLVASKLRNWNKRRILYTANFAVKHADREVGPYIALTELTNTSIKLLDTVNNSMTPEIRASKYGKQLEAFVKEIKATEQ